VYSLRNVLAFVTIIIISSSSSSSTVRILESSILEFGLRFFFGQPSCLTVQTEQTMCVCRVSGRVSVVILQPHDSITASTVVQGLCQWERAIFDPPPQLRDPLTDFHEKVVYISHLPQVLTTQVASRNTTPRSRAQRSRSQDHVTYPKKIAITQYWVYQLTVTSHGPRGEHVHQLEMFATLKYLNKAQISCPELPGNRRYHGK